MSRLCGATFRAGAPAFDTAEIRQKRRAYPRQFGKKMGGKKIPVRGCRIFLLHLSAKKMGGLSPSPNQAGGLGHYSSVPIPLSYRALLPFIMNQSSENIVTRSTKASPFHRHFDSSHSGRGARCGTQLGCDQAGASGLLGGSDPAQSVGVGPGLRRARRRLHPSPQIQFPSAQGPV